MKKINYVYTLLFLVFVSLMSGGLGWNNATDGAKDAYNIEHMGDRRWDQYTRHKEYWEMYDYNYDYSSHDWIADEALRMVVTSPYFSLWNDANNKPFWDEEGRRRKIFLYATAGPDWGPIVSIESKLGNTIEAELTKKYHRYWFDVNKNPSEDYLGYYAYSRALDAKKAIENGDCDLAAFYLGLMAHYVADSCLYLHVIQDANSKAIESYMAGRMDSCLGARTQSASNPYNVLYKYEFLQVSTLRVWVFPLQPDKCVRVVAYDTRFDADVTSGGLGTYNAEWMDEKYIDMPEAIKRMAKTRINWKSWVIEDSGTSKHNAYLFFNKLEESVDLGVHYLANAMTWVIQEVGTYKCSQGVQDLKEAGSKQIMLGMMFMLISYLGISLIEFFMRSSDSVWLLLYATV